jgi:integrase
LSIKINGTDFDTTFDTTTGAIHVRRSLWRNQIQAPKTPSAVRTVELAPELVALISDFAASRKSSFLFGNGAPLSESTARMDLQKKKIFGYHSFRRFRATHLRSFGNVPEEIIKSWLGHTNTSDITDRYSQLGKNQEIRRMWANKVGLGFNL